MDSRKETCQKVFGVLSDAPVDIFTSPSEHIPEVIEYTFTEDMVILGISWMFAGVCKNLFLSGPTGSGKSSFVEQFCARIGMPVYVVGCHGRMEFGDLSGSWCMTKDGKKWIDGPLSRAMKEGAVLLLDEANFLDPSVTGGLNRILDQMPFYVPETNETIHPHKNFRVAMTSNPFDPKYKGTKKMNIALLDRFLAGNVDYMSPLEETIILHRQVPSLAGWLNEFIISIAGSVRNQFKEGEMETTISTRGLVRWGKMLSMYKKSLTDAAQKKQHEKCCEIICKALGNAITDRSDPSEKQAINAMIETSFTL